MPDEVDNSAPLAPAFKPADDTSGSSGRVEAGKFTTDQDTGGSIEFPQGYKAPKPEPKEGEEGYVAPVAKEGDAVEEVVAEAGKEVTAEDEAADLGEWKTDPETQAKFDARYFKEGKLNEAVLSKEFFASKGQKDKDGKALPAGLKDSTYAYLQDTLGISKEFAKQVEAGLEANNAKAEQAFTDRVGGVDRYNAALEWGRTNYTPAQRERFNAARLKGGEDFLETVDALMLRYEKANPSKAGETRRGPPQGQRRSTPARTGTGAGAAPGGNAELTWANHEAYSKDWSKALAAQKAASTPQGKREAREHIERLRIAARKQFT